jgi:hypothetical protein
VAQLRALAGGRLLVSSGDGRITLVGADGVARPLANVPAGHADGDGAVPARACCTRSPRTVGSGACRSTGGRPAA